MVTLFDLRRLHTTSKLITWNLNHRISGAAFVYLNLMVLLDTAMISGIQVAGPCNFLVLSIPY